MAAVGALLSALMLESHPAVEETETDEVVEATPELEAA
jgi:hypothetical protein